jgi:hypothetical protein
MTHIYFYDPAANGNVFVSVDVYQTGLPVNEANRRLLEFFLDSLQTQQNFPAGAWRSAAAWRRGRTVGRATSTPIRNGVTFSGIVIAVTSPRTGLSYLVSVSGAVRRFQSLRRYTGSNCRLDEDRIAVSLCVRPGHVRHIGRRMRRGAPRLYDLRSDSGSAASVRCICVYRFFTFGETV